MSYLSPNLFLNTFFSNFVLIFNGLTVGLIQQNCNALFQQLGYHNKENYPSIKVILMEAGLLTFENCRNITRIMSATKFIDAPCRLVDRNQ